MITLYLLDILYIQTIHAERFSIIKKIYLN